MFHLVKSSKSNYLIPDILEKNLRKKIKKYKFHVLVFQMVGLTMRSDGGIDRNSWVKPVFNFARAVPPEPGEAQRRTLGQHCGAGHCAGHRLVQWTHTWDRQTDLKQRTHMRKVKECRHLPSAQDGDPEVPDLMPLTAKGHECFTRAQMMLAVRHQAEFTDKRSQWRAILDPPR